MKRYLWESRTGVWIENFKVPKRFAEFEADGWEIFSAHKTESGYWNILLRRELSETA